MKLPRGLSGNEVAKLQPYPAMRDSGVEWLGEVPKHWCITRTKWVLSRNDSGVWGSDSDDDGVIVLRSTEQTINGEWNIKSPAKRQISDSEYLSSRLEEGDLLVTTSSGSPLHIGKTTIVTKEVASLDCCFSNFMQRLRVNDNMMPRFLWYCLNGKIGRTQLDYLSDTTTGLANLSGKIIAATTFAIPTQSEQATIVRFLDHADRRIQRYIRAKEKLITLLEEQKQAIIHQAVTGRIDVRTGRPYPAYKPSGVEWLGDVPAHWEQPIKLKYISSLKGRLGWQGLKAGEYTTDGPYIVSSAHFRDRKISWELCPRVTLERYEMDKNIQLSCGDILLMKDGAAMGKLAFVDKLPGLACLNSHLLLLRPLTDGEEERYFPQFMFSYMQSESFQGYVKTKGTGATFLGISQESIGNHRVCFPSVSEQVDIVEYLNNRISDIDSAAANTRRQISLLREYRTRLIADVITGKLDVRSATAELPE